MNHITHNVFTGRTKQQKTGKKTECKEGQIADTTEIKTG